MKKKIAVSGKCRNNHVFGGGGSIEVERWWWRERENNLPILSHSLNTLRKSILHSLDQHRRNRLISRPYRNTVHLFSLLAHAPLLKYPITSSSRTCVSKFGSNLNKHPNLPSLLCSTVAPTIFLTLGSTPVTIPHLNPLTTF